MFKSELKMAERGRTWSEPEIAALLAKLAEAGIQRQLLGAVRNVHPYREIANELHRQGYERDYKQCREKLKALKKQYKEAVDKPVAQWRRCIFGR